MTDKHESQPSKVPQPKRAAAPQQTTAPATGPRVLVVDDDATLLRMTREVLTACRYRVTTAADGVEALHYFAAHVAEVDVVITDLLMPGITGAALIRAMREISPAVSIISVSGWTDESAAGPSAPGVQAQLRKPYTVEELLQALRQVLALPTDVSASSVRAGGPPP